MKREIEETFEREYNTLYGKADDSHLNHLQAVSLTE